MVQALIIDTETARIKNPVPIELAMIACTQPPHMLEVAMGRGPVFHAYYNPECDMDLGAVAAHHILPEDVEDKPRWKGDLKLECEYVVGHNVDFDLEAIYGAPDKIPTGIKRICTLALSRWAYPDNDSHKLSAMMYCVLGMSTMTRDMVKEAHGALPDAFMCLRLVRFFAQHFSLHTWESLYQQSEVARLPVRMSFGKHGPKDGQPGMLIEEMKLRDPSYVRWLLGLSDLDPYLRKVLVET